MLINESSRGTEGLKGREGEAGKKERGCVCGEGEGARVEEEKECLYIGKCARWCAVARRRKRRFPSSETMLFAFLSFALPSAFLSQHPFAFFSLCLPPSPPPSLSRTTHSSLCGDLAFHDHPPSCVPGYCYPPHPIIAHHSISSCASVLCPLHPFYLFSLVSPLHCLSACLRFGSACLPVCLSASFTLCAFCSCSSRSPTLRYCPVSFFNPTPSWRPVSRSAVPADVLSVCKR